MEYLAHIFYLVTIRYKWVLGTEDLLYYIYYIELLILYLKQR
jgi:hypothetical protein